MKIQVDSFRLVMKMDDEAVLIFLSSGWIYFRRKIKRTLRVLQVASQLKP